MEMNGVFKEKGVCLMSMAEPFSVPYSSLISREAIKNLG
jgi:hypothetical protein